MISLLGLRLARSTIETLLDRAPEGAAEKADAAIKAVPGVVDVARLRVRMVGPTHFIDANVQVPRTCPIDRIEEIKRQAQARVSKALGDADLTFTAVPVARDNESVRERIMVIARNSGLAIHHVTVHDLGGKLTVSIDLEVDGEMALARPRHRPRAGAQHPRRVRRRRRGRYPYRAAGTRTAARHRRRGRRVADDPQALSRFAADGAIHDIHNVRVRDTDAGEIVNFHCRAAPSMSVIKVHENVDEIERALRRAFPTVKRVISHAEPPRRVNRNSRTRVPVSDSLRQSFAAIQFRFRFGQDLFRINESLTLDSPEKTGFKSL